MQVLEKVTLACAWCMHTISRTASWMAAISPGGLTDIMDDVLTLAGPARPVVVSYEVGGRHDGDVMNWLLNSDMSVRVRKSNLATDFGTSYGDIVYNLSLDTFLKSHVS